MTISASRLSPASTSRQCKQLRPSRHHPDRYHQHLREYADRGGRRAVSRNRLQQIQAYDAMTGKELWAYMPTLDYSATCAAARKRAAWLSPMARSMRAAGRPCRGAGRPAPARWCGKPITPMPCPSRPISIPSPWRRSVYKGLILVGNAGAEWPTRGFLEALDAQHRQAGLALQHHRRARRAWRQELERRQLEIWRRLRCGTRPPST